MADGTMRSLMRAGEFLKLPIRIKKKEERKNIEKNKAKKEKTKKKKS